MSTQSEKFEVGQTASLSKVVTDGDLQALADVTLDRNPLHLDEDFARASRFGRRIAHGILGLGLISAVLGTLLPGPGAVYLSQEARFRAPVYVGDELTAVVTVECVDWRTVTLRTECFARDKLVITGQAKVLTE